MTRTKPTLEEIEAKIIIEEYFGYKLDFSDKPDLKTDNGEGIEVVQAIPEKDLENQFVYIKKIKNNQLATYKCPSGWNATEQGLSMGSMDIESLPIYTSLIKRAITEKVVRKKDYYVQTNSLFIKTLCPGLLKEDVNDYYSAVLSEYFCEFKTYFIYLEDEQVILKVTQQECNKVETDSLSISRKIKSLYKEIYKNFCR